MPPAGYYDNQLIIQLLSAIATIAAVLIALSRVWEDHRIRQRAAEERAQLVVVEFVPHANVIETGVENVREWQSGFTIVNLSDQAIRQAILQVTFYQSSKLPDVPSWVWRDPHDYGLFRYVLAGQSKTRYGDAIISEIRDGSVHSDTQSVANLRTDQIGLTLLWRDSEGQQWMSVDNERASRTGKTHRLGRRRQL